MSHEGYKRGAPLHGRSTVPLGGEAGEEDLGACVSVQVVHMCAGHAEHGLVNAWHKQMHVCAAASLHGGLGGCVCVRACIPPCMWVGELFCSLAMISRCRGYTLTPPGGSHLVVGAIPAT